MKKWPGSTKLTGSFLTSHDIEAIKVILPGGESRFYVRVIHLSERLNSSNAVCEEIVNSLELPDWTGRNWDAIIDVFSEHRQADEKRVIILWSNFEEYKRKHPRIAGSIVSVCEIANNPEGGTGYNFRQALYLFKA